MPNMDMSSSMGLIPGANSGGSNMAVPTAGGSNTPAIGGTSINPFLPQFPGGTTTPGMTNSINNADPNASPIASFDLNALLGNSSGNPNNPLLASGQHGNPGQLNAQGNWVPNQQDFIKALHKAGFSAGDAAMLFNFIQSGAGFNPQVAQAMIDAMQPGIKRNEADIMEWFGSQGLRDSSGSALAMGDYLSQVQLNEGQIFAGLYENAVQNYMTVLLGGKGPPPQNFFQNAMQFVNTMSASAANASRAAGTSSP